MYKHILLAVDLEHDSTWQKSLPTAVEYAQAFGSTIHVMVVVPDFGMSIVSNFFPKDHKKQAQDLAIEKLHAWTAANIPEGIPVQHIVGIGTPYEEILRVAGEVSVDLVVMGSHRPTMEDYLLGPNAARVVRHANCSVLVVRD
ncbi:MAG: universal stress protein [Alphaproteobacteria bacterium]|jgi:nucleotide-binding universal stress UspA family protein|nr:universal stress protein [Alphaproteobacteria bacterium]MBT4018576.1 universal stress protein [Alphaproteobacteria bacterium]MBT5158348.1 universal stress protein [Alphaproteobacteria bacterium]MBT5918917.1 universal stress protein [Alphaproteobacteria bacterium]MBT6385851.1 universal stress protein [Alphaproteobacteria bacterium]